MLFQAGEACILEAWRRRRKAGVDSRFWRLEGCIKVSCRSESNVRQRQPQAEGLVRPLVAWCFGVAEARFWRLEGCNLELVSSRILPFRKQR